MHVTLLVFLLFPSSFPGEMNSTKVQNPQRNSYAGLTFNSSYVSIRSAFMLELRRELGDRFEHFQSLDSFEKSSYVLGSEEYSSGLLGLIKDFVLSVWEERKVRLYGEHANVHQSHSQNDSGDLRGVAGGDGELGYLCGKAGTSHLCDGSAHSSGCVVNGSNAMAAV